MGDFGELNVDPEIASGDLPFIKKFATRSNFYIYDVNTNHFLQVDKVLYAIVDDIYRLLPAEIIRKWSDRFSEAELKSSLNELNEAIANDGLFRRERPVEFRPFGGRSIPEMLREPVCQHLILNVTETCNLRCRYCLYGGRYGNQRAHSAKRMSVEIATKALDYFIERSRGLDEANIGFYGGEPLLNLDLIKYCVSYAESKRPNVFRYGMTTNGTLIQSEIMDYLVDHKFNLLVSLDGPKEVHDRYRVDPQNRGTWDRVMQNLELLREKSRDYFENHVSVSAVIASSRKITQIQKFFETHPLLSNLNVITSHLVFTRNPVADDDPEQGSDSQECEHCSIYRRCETTLLEQKGLPQFLKGMFLREFTKIYQRDICDGFDGGIHINGCCFPGHRRLFVSCDGTFHVCERLDNAFPLGSVDEGLVPEKVQELIDAYGKVSADCLNCWAVRFCTKCYAGVCADGKIDRAYREAECHAFRSDFEQILILYHEVAEKNPEALDFLKDIVAE